MTKPVSAEIIAIGTELTTGRIVDSNSAYIANYLTSLGIHVAFQTRVGDEPGDMKKAFAIAIKRCDLVFASGGLGPTDDDITTQVITDYLRRKTVRDPQAIKNIQKWVKKRNRVLTTPDLKMAKVPRGAKIFKNLNGMASGYHLRYNKTWLIFTPAVPRELRSMMEHEIGRFLKAKVLTKNKRRFYRRTIRTLGVAESRVNALVRRAKIDIDFPEIEIGYQCPLPEIQIIFEVFSTESPKKIQAKLLEAESRIRQLMGNHVFGVDGETLDQVVHRLLLEKGKTLSLAESCTGGGLSGLLTHHSGASQYLKGGIICYSNESKVRDLQVSPDLLRDQGAVSAACSEAMAKGVCARFQSDFGVSITGIAGPEGGSEAKPVGTVYMALCQKDEVICRNHIFPGDRAFVRRLSQFMALDMLRKALLS